MNIPLSVDAENEFFRVHPERANLEEWLTLLTYFDECSGYNSSDWQHIKRQLYPPTAKDDDVGYDMKLRLSMWSPDSMSAIDKISMSMFAVPPDRYLNTYLDKWILDVANSHETLNAFTRKQFAPGLVYGSSFTVIQTSVKSNPVSLQDQMESTKPFLIYFTPYDLQNWGGRDENLWYLFRTKEYIGSKCYVKWYKVTSTEIIVALWDPKNSEVQPFVDVERSSIHNFGWTPVVRFCSTEPIDHIWGKSYLKNSAKLDVKKFRMESDLEYNRYVHMNPQLKVWAKEELGKLKINTNKFMKLSPGGIDKEREDIDYLSLPMEPFKVAQDLIKELRMQISQTLQIDPLGFVDSGGKFEASGESRKVTFNQSERRLLIGLADRAEEYETELLRRINQIITGEYDENIKVNYPDDFSVSSDDQLIGIWLKMKEDINSVSKEWKKNILNRISNMMVGDKPQINEIISKEIEESLNEAEESETTETQEDSADSTDSTEDMNESV